MRKPIQIIADELGIEEKDVERAIYKQTDCGAWVKFEDTYAVVGTIVEGSDAEYSEKVPLDCGEVIFCVRFWGALSRCEDFADDNFETDLTFISGQ